MNRKITAFLFALLIAVSPLCVSADEITYSASSSGEAVRFEYNPAEQAVPGNLPETGCRAAYLADPETGKVLYEKNAFEKMYPASTTKILTALLVLENCSLTETATVSRTALDSTPKGYSTAGMKAGEEFSVYTLLQALLIPSANEAAFVLAEHVSGSAAAFAKLCNKRAKELGCKSLHFVNPNGIHDENHYCCAYDLYLIAKECRKYEAFNEIVKTKYFTVPATDICTYENRSYSNTNEMLLPSSKAYYYPDCTGIKTGHTTPAGECLVSSCSRDNMNLICVVLGGKINAYGLNERFTDTKKLFDFAFENYSYRTVSTAGTVYRTVTVDKATEETASLDIKTEADISAIAPAGMEIQPVITIDDEIKAPVKQGEVLGQAVFRIDGLNYTADLVADHDVEKVPYWIYNLVIAGALLLILIVIIPLLRASKARKRKKR
ncbi:MAG: D-alanyl-D-alanine carboxypeptidase [Clostridia bacterium]|nr:D-alanyl-D-alanine carboxypeptidase [Clostridia bacterium]